MPHFFGNILGKNKIILENGWSNSAFFRPHLKNCYCDKRYLGKWVGDPLKIVQNESVTKKEYLLEYTLSNMVITHDSTIGEN